MKHIVFYIMLLPNVLMAQNMGVEMISDSGVGFGFEAHNIMDEIDVGSRQFHFDNALVQSSDETAAMNALMNLGKENHGVFPTEKTDYRNVISNIMNCSPNSICNPIEVPPTPNPFAPIDDGEECLMPNAVYPDCIPLAYVSKFATRDDTSPMSTPMASVEKPKLTYVQFTQTWSTVALIDNQDNTFCSGVMVSPNLVLTAAHCTCSARNNIPDLNAIFIGNELNKTNFIMIAEPAPVTFDADYCSQPNGSGGPDIALIPISTGDRLIQPNFIAELSFTPGPPEGTALLVGYGISTGDEKGGMREVFVFDEVKECTLADSTDVGCDPDREFFTKLPVGDLGGGCNGDSGAPLFNEISQVVGLQVRGIKREGDNDFNCGGGGIYTDLGGSEINQDGQTVEAWINSRIKE